MNNRPRQGVSVFGEICCQYRALNAVVNSCKEDELALLTV